MAALVAVLVGLTSAQTAHAAPGSGSPDAAVRGFITGVDKAAKSKSLFEALNAVCERSISPDIRTALEPSISVEDDESACGVGLLLLAGAEASDDATVVERTTPTITDVRRLGRNQAVVTVQQRDLDRRGRVVAYRRSAFLTSRIGGRWWIVTPEQLGRGSTAGPASVARLRRVYAGYRRRAVAVRRARQAALLVTRPFATLTPCPAAGLSQVGDATGDVIDQLANRKAEQPPSSDLVAVRSSADGDSTCFEIELAGPPPASGFLTLSLRPDDVGVGVSWGARGAVGQDGDDVPHAFGVAPMRGEHTLSFRVPTAELGAPAPGDRPAAQLATAKPGSELDGFVDSVPDEPAPGAQSGLDASTR